MEEIYEICAVLIANSRACQRHIGFIVNIIKAHDNLVFIAAFAIEKIERTGEFSLARAGQSY
jgi:hypothetical protein